VADLLTTGLVDEEDAPERVHELVDALTREPYMPEEQSVRSAR
jgi:predicted ArsR family transcriptional regulator